ncbi:MAG TPA: hypothetical protein VNJ01_13470 [Bacteriovoracaceae bacterium]|nr:hypothetical protein [Bacteriovoracaceae bacterium]
MAQIIGLIFFFISLSVLAEAGGAIFIKPDSSVATIVINEIMVHGDLSKLFDQIKLEPNSDGTKLTKKFISSHDRFEFVCNKSVHSQSAPSTSCTFHIMAGENTSDINTTIWKSGNEKRALLGVSYAFSKELEEVFGAIDLSFNVPGVISEFKIVGFSNSLIGFSSN